MKINIKTLKELFEQASQEALAASPAPTPEAQPQAQQPPATPPAQPQNNPQSQTSGGVVTVEKIVDHLNGIRSGKSFNDPLVYTAITNIFNGLSSSERAVLDKALSQLDKSIDQITKQQSPPNPNNQEVKGPAVQPQMNAPGNGIPNGLQGPQQVQQIMSSSPAAGMMNGVLAETLSSLSESINSPNKSTMIVVNGKEVPFGSEEHLGQLTIVLNGLDSLKSCYRKGSSARSTLAGACQRIRKILNDNAGAAVGSVQPLMVTTDKE